MGPEYYQTMKKIISFTLFAVSASSSLLLAQSESKQVTVYRLQAAGSNSETACREQIANNRKVKLLSENQVNQQAGTTTNYEPRTTNCDNSGTDLNCYLMMNPETIQGFEEVLKVSRNPFFLSEACSERETLNAAQVLPIEGECSISTIISSEGNVIENTPQDNKNSYFVNYKDVDKNFTNIKEKISAIISQIETTKQASKEKRGGENSYLWDRIATKLEQARDSWNKVHELMDQGKEERASLWRKVAEESEVSAERMRELIGSYILGKKETAEQLEKETWNAYYLSDAATWSLKSEELEKASLMEGEKEGFWRGLAEQYQVAADCEKKASEAHLADKDSERNSWAWTGRLIHSSAEYQIKADKARESQKPILEADYREIAATFQCAADQYKKSAETYIAEKDGEGTSRYWAGNSLQSVGSYQIKASEAREAGKVMLAEGYKNAISISHRAADQHQQATERKAEGKKSEGNSWGWEGSSLQTMADYQAKAYEVEEAGKIRLAAAYREASVISGKAAGHHRQSAEDSAAGKESASTSWYWVGKFLQTKADYHAKASEAEEVCKVILAAGYKEAAVTLEIAADQGKLAAKAHAVEKKKAEGDSWREYSKSFYTMAIYQVKAHEMEEVGNSMLAQAYREVVLMCEQAAEHREFAAKAYALDNKDEGDSWDSAGKSFQSQADYYKKAIEAREAGKEVMAAGYDEAAETSRRAAEKQKESALACIEGKDGNLLYCEGDSIQSQADYQAKTVEAGEVGKITLAASYREVAAIYQHAADRWEKGVIAFASEKDKEATAWAEAALSLTRKAECQKKIIQEQDTRKEALLAGYREAIEIAQAAVEYYQQAAEAFALEKEEEGIALNTVGKFLQSKAADQVKVVEQKETEDSKEGVVKKDKNLLSSRTRTNEIHFQNKSNTRKKMALSICCEQWLAETKSAEGAVKILSDYVIDALKRGADHVLVRAFEKYWSYVANAHELGDYPQALAWIQVAEDIQQAIKDSIQQTNASKSNELSKAWKSTVEKGQELAEYREKYIQATTSFKSPELILILKKVVEGSQSTVNYLRKAAEARSLKKEQEYERFNDIATAMIRSVKKLKKAVDAFQKSIDTAAKGEVEASQLWRKIAVQRQESARYYNEIAMAKISGNDHYDHFYKALQSIKLSIRSLEEAVNAQAKATQAIKENKGELAESWFNIVKQYEESAAYYQQSAEAYVSENEIEGDRLGGDLCHKESIGYMAMETAKKLEGQVRALEKK